VPRPCAICTYDLATLERCPECGAPAPLPRPTSDDQHYRPSDNSYHTGRGSIEFHIRTRNHLSELVAPPFHSLRTLLPFTLFTAAFAAVGFLCAAFIPDRGAVLFGWAFAGFATLMLLGIIAAQFWQSRQPPLMTIDHAARTLDLRYRDPLPIDGIQDVEFVTYTLESSSPGRRKRYGGLSRLVLDLGPAAPKRFYEFPTRFANPEHVGRQIAQALGLPFRRVNLGTVRVSGYYVS